MCLYQAAGIMLPWRRKQRKNQKVCVVAHVLQRTSDRPAASRSSCTACTACTTCTARKAQPACTSCRQHLQVNAPYPVPYTLQLHAYMSVLSMHTCAYTVHVLQKHAYPRDPSHSQASGSEDNEQGHLCVVCTACPLLLPCCFHRLCLLW